MHKGVCGYVVAACARIIPTACAFYHAASCCYWHRITSHHTASGSFMFVSVLNVNSPAAPSAHDTHECWVSCCCKRRCNEQTFKPASDFRSSSSLTRIQVCDLRSDEGLLLSKQRVTVFGAVTCLAWGGDDDLVAVGSQDDLVSVRSTITTPRSCLRISPCMFFSETHTVSTHAARARYHSAYNPSHYSLVLRTRYLFCSGFLSVSRAPRCGRSAPSAPSLGASDTRRG